MTIESVIQRIEEVGIIPVIRAASVDDAKRAVEAISAGGIPVAEITMTVPNAVAVIREVCAQYRDTVLVGAGTVVTADQAEACLDAGAEFLVSPGFSAAVLDVADASRILAIPGALTPTELMTAQGWRDADQDFPCGNVGGAKYLRSLKAPFPKAKLIPTGGVNAANAAEFIAAGAFALGVGADLVDAAALRAGDLKKISAAAQELVHAVMSARAALKK